MYIHRLIESVVKKAAKQFPAVVVSGPRQSGKSTLLKNIFASTHKYVTFDEPLTRQRAVSDPRFFLDSISKPVILDEIQYVPEILSYIKILIDEDRDKRGKFIFTGSQQFNMIKNLGDSLAGRIAALTLLPFCAGEKALIPSFKKRKYNAGLYFADACLRGSFPEISTHLKIDFEAWYGSYIQTYLERDVRSLYEIGSLREFQSFMQLLASRCSQILNLSSIAQDLGLSVNTIKRWLSILQASQIVYLLQPYYRNLGKRVTKSPKIYFLDCALVSYLTGIRDERYLLSGPMSGALFENYVIQETVKFFYNRGLRPNIYYIRTHNELEIDLIIEEKMRLFPFEIKMTKTPKLSVAASIKRFGDVFSKFKIEDGNVIYIGEDKMPLSAGVSALPVDNYLDLLKDLIK